MILKGRETPTPHERQSAAEFVRLVRETAQSLQRQYKLSSAAAVQEAFERHAYGVEYQRVEAP